MCILKGVPASALYAAAYLFLFRGAGTIRFPHMMALLLLLAVGAAAALVTRELTLRLTGSCKRAMERKSVVAKAGLYVTPQMADAIHETNTLQLEVRELTVPGFSLRKFTAYIRKRSPYQLYRTLSALFRSCSEVIASEDGIMTRLTGDGFTAVFGAPLDSDTHCDQALSAGMRILQEMETFNNKLNAGIGIHTGTAVCGTLGNGDRQEYTVVGPVVQLTEKIQQLTGKTPHPILLSRKVYDKLSAQRENCRYAGRVKVKSPAGTIELYTASPAEEVTAQQPSRVQNGTVDTAESAASSFL